MGDFEQPHTIFLCSTDAKLMKVSEMMHDSTIRIYAEN